MGAEVAIIGGLTALSSAVSIAATAQSNATQRRIAEYQNRQKELAYRKSVAFNRAAGEIKAAEDKRTLQIKYDLMKGASLAQGAERGTLESRVQEQTLNALGYNVSRESAKIEMERNLADLGFQINAQPQWSVAGSNSAFLAGIQGGLQGLQLGMSVAGGLGDLRTTQAAQGATTGTNVSTGVPWLLQAPNP